MNQLLKIWSFLLIMAFIVSCQSSTKEAESSEDQTTEDVVEAVETQEEISQTILNPNLATQQELEGILSAELVSKVLESRPFLSMTDLDALLSETMDSVQRATLYSDMFVPFNLNTTPEGDFKIIPGVGDRMAHEFEEYRPYIKIEQFRKEIGKYVDDAEVARYEHYVFVPVELNTASKEEIMAIPGVGERMHHEFEEYRPYKSMDQFRKEIGKYVDDKELARLERFVYIEENN